MYKFRHCLQFYCKSLKYGANIKNKTKNQHGLTWCKKRYFHQNARLSSSSPQQQEAFFELFGAHKDVTGQDEMNRTLPENTKSSIEFKSIVKSEEVQVLKTNTRGKQFSENYLENYLEACCKAGFLVDALDCLQYNSAKGVNVKLFELVFKTLLESHDVSDKSLAMEDLLRLMEEENIECSTLCYIYQISINQQNSGPETTEMNALIFEHLQSAGHDLQELTVASLPLLSPLAVRYFTRALHQFDGDGHRHQKTIKRPSKDGVGLKGQDPEWMTAFDKQIAAEMKCLVDVPNVMMTEETRKRNMNSKKKEEAAELHKKWKFSLLCIFRQRRFELTERWMSSTRRKRNEMLNVVPFLHILPDEDYVDIMINTMKSLPLNGAITSHVCMKMGQTVRRKWHVLDQDQESLATTYANYMRTQAEQPLMTSRDAWMTSHTTSAGVTTGWSSKWSFLVGLRLLELMVSSLTIDGATPSGESVPSAYFRHHIPAVFNSFKPWGTKVYSMTIPHPVYVQLNKSDLSTHYTFDCDLLPMMTPTKPWLNQNEGGFLVYPTQFVRTVDNLPGDVTKVCEALNVISSVAWNINKKVFDIQLDMFRKGGNSHLGIPPPKSSAPPLPDLKMLKNIDELHERIELKKAWNSVKKVERELYSLYCHGLFKFTIANHCRDRTFWLPHSLDFRGRAYPVPPHFNYMGGDENRALFKFNKGKELGESGLKWLKIHLVNLTDLKKSESNEARHKYFDEIVDEVFDSADRPLDGSKWWMESNEPWQTLSCCMELTRALRSRDPIKYVSNLPIYQDGSCNGLQHYAAMGRDIIGAQQVNLSPAERPQDIYSGVLANVEQFRKQDAQKGHEIAKLLDGMITRKVVKQTVMTTVYGVTRYGGSLQIQRQLLDIPNFPAKYAVRASNYLVLLIFNSLDVMFSGAFEIKKWLQEVAEVITKGGQTVEWITPLGLQVVQPYFKYPVERLDSVVTRLTVQVDDRTTEKKPNIMKQRNAFPPNFIHSLDATHMMLTALECQKNGITFSAVHDCYWTHACNVDQMNRICRKQFVNLHNQPILENLIDYLTEKLLLTDKLDQYHSDKLQQLFENIPQRGDFDLDQVNRSTYFFC